MPAMSAALVADGIDPKQVQILGTGLWNDARVLDLPGLQGAWFAAPENGGFNAFANRYPRQVQHRSDPVSPRSPTMPSRSPPPRWPARRVRSAIPTRLLLNKSGFNGADGVFRFKGDGTNDRGLSVLQINGGKANTISPAPHSFPAGSAT